MGIVNNNELNTKVMGNKIIHFNTIESTNDYAKSIGYEEKEGTVIISETQTKGRGRLGRKWSSKQGEGIYMSIILKPNIELNKTPFLTLIAGASIVKVLNDLEAGALIKWPNDIILNSKKIGGILSELAIADDKVSFIVIGIGINVNNREFPNEISDIATSLYKEGYEISKDDIVKQILFEFEKLYFEYVDDNYKKTILDICKTYSAIINKNIYIVEDNKYELVKYVDINEDGNLIIETQDNKIKEIISGEVSIRGIKGYI